jgi:hypothetical protein
MEPATRHRYQYALNNPATLVDLYGFESTDKYYISPDVLKDIKLQGPIMDQNLMYGTQPYGGGTSGLYTTSSSQLFQQSNSQLWLAGTQHSPLTKSLFGGSYLGYIDTKGYFVPVASHGCGIDMSCRYAQEWSAGQLKSYADILDKRLNWLQKNIRLRNYMYNTVDSSAVPSKVEQVRIQLDKELGSNGRIQIGSVYDMDTSGMGNIVFGYYMEALSYPTWAEDLIANIAQGSNEGSRGHFVDFPDDVVQRRIGRELANRTGGDPSKITPQDIVSAAAYVCSTQGSSDPGCTR